MSIARSVLDGLQRRLREHAGLELPAWVVESRAAQRMEAVGVNGSAYVELLDSRRGAAELAALVEAVRVGETRFFRHHAQFDALVELVVPHWVEVGEKTPLVWSAGCATGEEAYTLAMVLAHAFPSPAYKPQIVATDLSDEALAIARRGAYASTVLSHVPETYKKDFVVRGATARIRPEIASLVTFEPHNLASFEAPKVLRKRPLSLVFCRNVLIYFDAQARRSVIDELVETLGPGGFLFVGYSESLRDVETLVPIRAGDQVVWQKRETAASAIEPRPRAKPTRTARVSHRPPAPKVEARAKASDAAQPPTVHVAARAPAELSAKIATALGRATLSSLTVDLDAVEVLDDEVARILRRAAAAARASGVDLRFATQQPATNRWLGRHRLGGGSS
ncbi:MAG: hypothetical protein HOW73_31100 [Polyangiaceae bacterium]|nr:hypothetical protein [Polyangiaceae bacterium]